MLFSTPQPDLEDLQALQDLADMRARLADLLRVPKRWDGGLRRSMLARAIQGSNSIEGYQVEVDDAAAALDDEDPLSADQLTFAEIRGYRQALGYVLAMASDEHFDLDSSVIRSMHFMLLNHDPTKRPGQYRSGAVHVVDPHDTTVYEGPEPAVVPALVEELVRDLEHQKASAEPVVLGAMAHLNLVMIHPFRDGNGRLARALQTLVLSRTGVAEPAFSSIEEWLGSNTDDYYRVLSVTGGGSWHPENDAHLWVKFNIRAHHIQAQTVARRFDEASSLWAQLDDVIADLNLHPRVADELYDASLGFRIRRSTYIKRAQIEQRTATRDLARLVAQGLLEGRGETSGRHYVAGELLRQMRSTAVADRTPVSDPYPWMKSSLYA